MKDPAFLFYTNDFISGTQFFSDEQLGKYIRLLCAQHQHGHLSEKHILMICKRQDEDTEDILKKFTTDNNGLFFNKRLEFEIQRRLKYSLSRSENRSKKELKHKKKICKRYVKDMETVTVTENKDINVMAVKGVQGENDIFERKKNFYEKVGLTYSDKYEKEMLIKFCDYWTEHNENGKKMRFEMQEVFNIARRLSTWKSNQKQFSQNGNTNSNRPKSPGELLEETIRLAKSRRTNDADTSDSEYGKAK